MSKSKPTIAVVDDDPSVCRAISRLLRSLGMNADTFTSGHEFIKHIQTMPSFRPDCVVLDVQMLGMNGLEV
jgi:FixJ family two-component response regulator